MNCKYHEIEHTPKLLDDFTRQCERLGITVGQECPIQLVMEAAEKMPTLEPEYQIFNKLSTEIQWPHNIDILVTKFPATEKDGFTKGLAGFIANKAYTYMNSNSLAYVMISSFKEEKMRPFAIVDIFTAAGFKFIDTIIWVKNKFIPTQGSKRLNNIYDFIFMFSKGDNYHLNRQSVAHLKGNIGIDDEIPISDEYLCPGNVWKIKIDDKDITPGELIECLIKLSNPLPNSTIVDPFMDSGTVLRTALTMGHSFWGCEQDRIKFKKCKKIVDDYRSDK